ncbi:hypothetical protein [uncultured Aeromicrobium sp.]|uniref:hypothetical protein n=1 Tax=uncultured Aeromicrobium sp. TaxID=337820 RepID=UPI0025ECCD23|nr:hypothetical protein [uncultured Aeromicrobium sp.]
MTAAPITVLRPRDVSPAGLVFEEPPARTNVGRYAEIAAALRERPGRWAVVKTWPAERKKAAWSFASHVNSGKLADMRGGFEATARTIDGQTRVYVRYVDTDKEA